MTEGSDDEDGEGRQGAAFQTIGYDQEAAEQARKRPFAETLVGVGRSEPPEPPEVAASEDPPPPNTLRSVRPGVSTVRTPSMGREEVVRVGTKRRRKGRKRREGATPSPETSEQPMTRQSRASSAAPRQSRDADPMDRRGYEKGDPLHDALMHDLDELAPPPAEPVVGRGDGEVGRAIAESLEPPPRVESAAPEPRVEALPSARMAPVAFERPRADGTNSTSASDAPQSDTYRPPAQKRGGQRSMVQLLGVGITAGVVAAAAVWLVIAAPWQQPSAAPEPTRRAPEPLAQAVPAEAAVPALAAPEPGAVPVPAAPEPGGAQPGEAQPGGAQPIGVDLGPVPDEIAALPRMRRRQMAQDLRIRARDLHRREEYQRAQMVWQLALQYDPESGIAAEGLAKTLARLNLRSDSRTWARRAVELDPRSPRHHETLGYFLRLDGDLGGAIEQYRAGLRHAPDDLRLQRRLRVARRLQRR